MRTKREITEIANGIYEEITTGLKTLTVNRKAVVDDMLSKTGEARLPYITELVAAVETFVQTARYNDVGLPQYLSRVTYQDGDLSKVTISVRTKLKAAYKYKYAETVDVNADFIMNVGQVFISGLYSMFHREMAMENVVDLNAEIAKLLKENEIPYKFGFAVEPESNAMVLSINDDEVVFNAGIEQAQCAAGMSIFRSGDEFNDLVREQSVTKLIEALRGIQTTPQLVKGNIKLIKEITGVSTKRYASKLIRGSYHRKTKNLDAVKSGIGYFDKKVEIDGKEVNVFALVAKAENGDLSVVLSPFDTQTLFNVKFDVLAAVNEQLA